MTAPIFPAMLARLFFVFFCLAASVATPGEAPMQVTSDTPGYCAGLAQRMADVLHPRPEAVRLAEQGRDLCAQHRVRAGIRRLREALLLSAPAPAGP